MRKIAGTLVLVMLGLMAAGGCDKTDPDVRRGNMFFENKKWDDAFKAYEKAVEKDPKLLDGIRQNFKNAYYYHGGQLEINDAKDGAIKYYEKGFALDPSDAGMCDKLAKYYWEEENFEKASNYFQRLVELDGEMPDTDKKWAIMGNDAYALGYAYFQIGKFKEAITAFEQSLKVAPKGAYAAKSKESLEAARAKLKK